MGISFSNAWKQIQSLANDLISLLPNLVIASILLGLAWLLARSIASWVRSFVERTGQSHGVALLLGRIAQYIVILFGLLVALSTIFPSFRARDLIQVLGIGGVAIGFAFKDIFQNFLAGIIILISRPFRIGDQIVLKEFEGTVEDIQTRATLIRTYDNRIVVVPNTVLFSEEVTVLTRQDKRRSEYDLGIGYGDDVDRAIAVSLKAIEGLSVVEKDPRPDAIVVGLADSSVTLRLRWWTTPTRADVLRAQDEVLRSVKAAFAQEGIDLPFPVQTILFHNQTEEVDGDRRRQREGWPAGTGEVPRPARSVRRGLGDG